MRANYGYNGAEDDDSPVHGMALSFEPKDFLHIKEVNIIFQHSWSVRRFHRKFFARIAAFQLTRISAQIASDFYTTCVISEIQ